MNSFLLQKVTSNALKEKRERGEQENKGTVI